MSESQLIYKVMQELGKHGAVYRCNSGSVKMPNGSWFKAMPKGFADVMLILPTGQACFVECKTDKGKLSEEQERFINKMRILNARAGVARSVNEALQICGLNTINK